MAKILIYAGGIILAVWLLSSDPLKQAAYAFWPNSPAPWEDIEGYYYPDRESQYHRFGRYTRREGFASVEDCRRWAMSLAERLDREQQRSAAYSCAWGLTDVYEPHLRIYRGTTRTQPIVRQ